MSSRINKTDEDIFQNGESLFLSTVIIINETGERTDRILLIFTNHLILLAHNQSKPSEFDFDSQIPFVNTSQSSQTGLGQNNQAAAATMIQIKKVSNLDSISKSYGSSTIEPASLKYCFELVCTNGSRYLVVCSTNYDLKMLIELISNQLSNFNC